MVSTEGLTLLIAGKDLHITAITILLIILIFLTSTVIFTFKVTIFDHSLHVSHSSVFP